MARKTGPVKVRMHNAKANRYYDAPPSAVAFWEAHGWKRADADTTPSTSKTTAKAAEKKEV
ncbi:hypothetical protein [Nocardiopsis sp. FR26]|uniref:hypothetical protein n=1 Tax=Nocardiopsis sp. FR26 TaxID=2605987 RepID=UPI0013586650|nr:hypothetical protein [Nocardiopsis sp. FR26]